MIDDTIEGGVGFVTALENLGDSKDKCERKGHCDEEGRLFPSTVKIPYDGGFREEVLVECNNCGRLYNRKPTEGEVSEAGNLRDSGVIYVGRD